MMDKPVLNTPGEMLRRARREAGLELDEVSERTKIPPAVLRSLELDEYHKISGALYVNSFLRTYADDLGLDPVLVLDSYQRFSGEVVPAVAGQETEAVWVEEEVQIRRVGLPWASIAAAVAGGLAVILAIVWLVGLRDGGEPAAERLPDEQPEAGLVTTAVDAGEEDAAPDGGETLPEETGGPDETDTSKNGSVPEQAAPERTDPAPTPPRTAELPRAIPGDRSVPFAGGEKPLVLRLLSQDRVGARVACDSERDYTDVRWPRAADIETLPSSGIRAGRPYRTRQGLVVYWGANDQFSLKLDRTVGVEISLNGRVRSVSDLKPGQEQILYLPAGER